MWSIFSRSSLSSFPYDILESLYEDNRSIWKLHKGKRKHGNEEVSIFFCDEANDTCQDLSKAAIKRLKMLKHPSILKFIDSLEADKSVYLVTEPVTPLCKWLQDSELNQNNTSNIAAWGLLNITKGIAFMNNDGKLVHHNINSSNIFVTRGGEWKLFGLEYATADSAYYPVKILPQLKVYDPPESQATNRKPGKLWSTDMWGLGCLIWEVFNKQLNKSTSLQHTNKIPKSILPTYCELVGANPMGRPNPQEVINKLRKPGQFFRNDLIETLMFLDEIHIKDDAEKHRFFSSLTSKLANVPDFIAKNKILPALLSAHEFSNVGSVLLSPMFMIGRCLEDSEYQSQIVPCVVRMFSSTDRATRLKLLQQMESLAEHLDTKTVNEQIFQPLVTGFQDTNPVIREHSVKAILFLAPKFNHNNLNVEILKHFARLQSRDDQGGIRTNTTVCLGKISSCLHPETRQKCLVSAFTRAMKDPFPPARIAGVTAIGATQQYYPLTDVATKIIPALSMLTIDPEKEVRNAVFRVVKGFFGKLEKVSEDPDLREVMEKEVSSASSSLVSSSWAGWAVGALASKFYKGPQSSAQPREGSLETTSSEASTKSSSITASAETSKRNTPSKARKTSTDGWSEDWKDDEPKNLNTLSEAMRELDTPSAHAGDGWEDEEDWGSLEVEETETQSSQENQLSDQWGSNVSSEGDFFSPIESNDKVNINQIISLKSPSNANSSWDSWDDTGSTTAAQSDSDVQKTDIVRKQREERKAQRLKDIENRRAAKSGPMKLGAKKLDL